MKKFVAGLLFSAVPIIVWGQTDPASEPAQMSPSPAADTNVVPTEGVLSRWLDLNTLSFGMRYRNTADANGAHLFEYGQQRSLIDGALKLDKEGKYAVHFHISSGKYFNWAYASVAGGSFAESSSASISRFTPAELGFLYQTVAVDPFLNVVSAHIGERGWEMYVRQLYMSAAPVKELTMEYGGLGIERGASTEMTTYDEDGYMVGGRARIKDPKHLFFDQIALTFGYLGDIYSPSVFDRSQDFKRTNYEQYLVEKKIAKRLDATIDYTQHLGTHTMREAALVNVPEAKVVDSVRGEFYQRMNVIDLNGFNFAGGNGFGFTGSKKVMKNFKLEGGFASVDKNYPVYTGSSFMVSVGHSINGDAYAIGNRFFGKAIYKPLPYVSCVGYYTHIVDTDYMTLNKETLEAGVDLDMKELLNQKWHLF